MLMLTLFTGLEEAICSEKAYRKPRAILNFTPKAACDLYILADFLCIQ
jgi:hypothetical protein